MIVLSLDQALKTTGWCLFDEKENIKFYGTFNIKPTRSIDERLLEFWNFLDEMKEEHNFNYIVFEEIQNQNNNETYKKLAMVQAIIYLWCAANFCSYTVMSPSHWRSVLNWDFGKKRAEQKENAMKFVKEKFNADVGTDAADAICIGTAFFQEKEKEGSAF